MNNTIEAIIFDLGNVIIDIDPKRTLDALKHLACKPEIESEHLQRFDNLNTKLETAIMDPPAFRAETRKLFHLEEVDDEAFDAIWNKLILDVLPHRIRLLDSLSKKYRIFLLSNSNLIHHKYYCDQFRKLFPGRNLEDLFEKAFFSFQLGLRKPDIRIFETVIRQCGLYPPHSVFIDDLTENVNAANKCGLIGLQLKKGTDISGIFDDSLALRLSD